MIANLPDGNSPLSAYEIFAEVDFIVTDLDGTLIAGDFPVLKQIKDSILRLKKKQTQITVATGRTYYGAKTRIQELGINFGMPVAVYNGGIVVEYGTGNVLYESYISCKVIQDLLRFVNLEKNNIYVYTFALSIPFFSEGRDECVKEVVYAWGKPKKKKDVNGMDIHYMQEKSFFKKNITAILIESNMTQREKEILVVVLQQYPHIRITDSGNGFIEIKGKGKDKGIINDILREEKFSAKKILAIGDNNNDVELFKGADISVAVGNTSDLAREYADYVCERDSAEGFSDMLKVLEDSKRYYGEKNEGYGRV